MANATDRPSTTPRRRLDGLRRRLLGPPVPARPSARVRALIAERQADSEILIGWVQAAAILGFAVVYALSPKAFPPDVPFEPVPWALGFYALFTLVRLRLAYRDRLGPFLLAFSVVLDVAVLLGTIWSFHIQYDQPPALSLKAPTLMYAFVLIALRALRAEARYVLLAGATAAAGWLALVAHAAVLDPRGMTVTGDYVAWATSNSILVGAEVDKVIALSAVTLVLAVAILRARRALYAAAGERVASGELARFFDPDVAATIRAADLAIRPGEGMMRDAAILVVDLRGFTSLARGLEPGAVIALLEGYHARVVPAIRDHGGSIDKFLGDGVLASFGAVRPNDAHAADALRAAEDVLAAGEAWSAERRAAALPPVRVGCAVAAGPVVFGAIGAGDRLEYTVIGDAVNLAVKLETATKAEGVRGLATADALDSALAQGYRPKAPVPVRRARPVAGVERPLDLAVIAA